MTVYLIIFFVLICAVSTGFGSNKSILKRSSYALAIVLMVACAGLRAESVGRDLDVYREYFSASPDTIGIKFLSQWISTMPMVDVAYVYCNSLVKLIGLPFEVLVFSVALTAVTLNALFFWRHSRFSAIALMVYFSHAFLVKEMVQIRAGLACAISLWAFHYWAINRKRTGTVLVFAAVLMHLAAVIIMVPLLLFHFKVDAKPKHVLLTLIGAIVIGYNLNSSIPIFGLLDRLGQYQDSEYSVSGGIFSNVVTIKQLAILMVSCLLMKAGAEPLTVPVFKLCLTSYWISTIWMIVFNQFQILGQRGAAFLWMGEPLIVAQIVVAFFHGGRLKRYRQVAVVGAVCFALATLVLDLKTKEVFNDYKTVFQQ
jgi:EpsG-like putative glucosyltransferase